MQQQNDPMMQYYGHNPSQQINAQQINAQNIENNQLIGGEKKSKKNDKKNDKKNGNFFF